MVAPLRYPSTLSGANRPLVIHNEWGRINSRDTSLLCCQLEFDAAKLVSAISITLYKDKTAISELIL